MITKLCSKCNIEKTIDQYYKNKKHKDGLSGYCKVCHNHQSYAYRKSNPDKFKQIQRRAALKGKYNISEEQYQEMFHLQGGVCEICKLECPTGKALAVDHSHQTGNVRALLCSECNTGLGKFKDNPTLLRAAINYLEKYEI